MTKRSSPAAALIKMTRSPQGYRPYCSFTSSVRHEGVERAILAKIDGVPEVAMKQVAATEAKNRFGQILEMTISEPIAIEKKGRRVAVMLSFAEYQRLVELEDRYWGEKAQKALEGGFVSEESGNQWLKEKLNAETADK